MASVTKRSSAAREGRRAAVRHKLLSAVDEIVSSGVSFTELSVEQLAGSAGIARSTFYVYYDDKGALLEDGASEVFRELAEATRGWYRLPPDATRDDLEAALRHVIDTYLPHAAFMAAVIDAASYDSGLQAAVDRLMRHQVDGLRQHIERGQAAGSVDPDVPAASTAGWLTWMSERGLHKLTRSRLDADDLARGYTAVLWNTLYRGARSRYER